MWMQPSCCSEASVKFIPVCYSCCCQSVIWIEHRAAPSLLRAPTRASVVGSMRLRGLFDRPSNLSTGQWGFEVPLQIYLRLHEVSGSPWHSFKIIYGSCRGFIDPPSHGSTGPWSFAVSLNLLRIYLPVNQVSGSLGPFLKFCRASLFVDRIWAARRPPFWGRLWEIN